MGLGVILTILVPSFVAIGIAIYSSKQTTKEVNRQIASMQQNSEREVKQLKELAQLGIEALNIKLDMELIQRTLMAQQADEEREGMQRIMSTNHLTFQDLGKREFESKQPERNHKYTMAFIQELKKLSERLEGLRKQL